MAFSTGVPASLGAFFTDLRTFATTNAGFTNNGTAAINGNTVHILSKGGVFWNFEETITEQTGSPGLFNMYYARCRMTYSAPTTTFDETTPTGQKRFTHFGSYGTNSSYTGYYFYTDGTAVHAVLEVQSGVFQHISFGTITKYGTWTGGEYLTAGCSFNKNSTTGIYGWTNTNSNFAFPSRFGDGADGNDEGAGFNSPSFGFVRYEQSGSNQDDFAPMGNLTNGEVVNDFDEQHALLCGSFTPTNNPSVGSDDYGLYSSMMFASPNAVNFRAALFPMLVRLRNRNASANPSFYFIAGKIPNVTVVNNQNIANAELVNTDWQVFPTTQKDGDDTVAPVSTYVGFAYRRV